LSCFGFFASRLLRRFFWDIGIPSGAYAMARISAATATLDSIPLPVRLISLHLIVGEGNPAVGSFRL
jgi:hypothetical protein